MQKALSKKSQKKVAQKKVAQRHSGKKREDVIILNNVWKIFGLAADEAMQAVQERGLGKSEVLSEFGCVVGLADCSFAVKRGEVFCIMALPVFWARRHAHAARDINLNRLIPDIAIIAINGGDTRT